jgi:hypothetical protein
MARLSIGFSAVLLLLAAATACATRATIERAQSWNVARSAQREGGLAEVRTLAFDFIVRVEGKPDLVFHHAYDRDMGLYRYETTCADFAKVPVWDETAGDRWQVAPDPPVGGTLVAVYHFPHLEGTVYVDGEARSGAENARLLRRVHSRVMNERAWMFLPLFVASPGARVSPAPRAVDPIHGNLSGFEIRWSDERGESDEWTIYESRRELVRTDFRLKHDLETSTTAYWSEWKWYGPVRIAGVRSLPSKKRTLLFTNVAVNAPVDVSPPGA